MRKKISKNSVKNIKNFTIKNTKILTKKHPKFVELKGFLSFFILHELSQAEMTGEELAVIIGKRRGSVLTPGTIYPALKRLKKQKLIKYRREGRKKIYYLLPDGIKEINALYRVFSSIFGTLRSKLIKKK